MTTLPITEKSPVAVMDVALAKLYNVILFNDEVHTADEVVAQIIKAIHCPSPEADRIMLEAHSTGRAIVVTAGLERCEHVESVLQQIRLGTKIEQA